MQASRFECLPFDPFSLLQNGLVTSEVDIGWCDVVDALMIPLVIVVVDEGFNLSFKITRQEVVLPARCGSSRSDAIVRSCLGFVDDMAHRESASCPCPVTIPPDPLRRS